MLSSAPFECPSGLLQHAQQHPPLKTAVVNAATETVMTSARLATDNGLIEPILIRMSLILANGRLLLGSDKISLIALLSPKG